MVKDEYFRVSTSSMFAPSDLIFMNDLYFFYVCTVRSRFMNDLYIFFPSIVKFLVGVYIIWTL